MRKAIRTGDRVSIQVHHLDLNQDGTPVARDVRAVAISVPESMRADVAFE